MLQISHQWDIQNKHPQLFRQSEDRYYPRLQPGCLICQHLQTQMLPKPDLPEFHRLLKVYIHENLSDLILLPKPYQQPQKYPVLKNRNSYQHREFPAYRDVLVNKSPVYEGSLSPQPGNNLCLPMPNKDREPYDLWITQSGLCLPIWGSWGRYSFLQNKDT